jgi:ATP-dependent Clp protease, protease subunit
MGRSAKNSVNSKTKNNEEDSVTVASAVPVSTGVGPRLVVLHGDVNESTISLVVAQLLHLASLNHKPIHLVISTYGGSVDEMFMLYDTIKFLPCPVHTVALGKVMSAGVLLLASGTKGKRMIGKSARIMIHPVSGGVMGDVFEVMNDAREHKRLQEQMVDAIVKESKSTRSQIEKIMSSGHDYYLLPEQAIKLGIVDKIIGEDAK